MYDALGTRKLGHESSSALLDVLRRRQPHHQAGMGKCSRWLCRKSDEAEEYAEGHIPRQTARQAKDGQALRHLPSRAGRVMKSLKEVSESGGSGTKLRILLKAARRANDSSMSFVSLSQ